jgi:kynurenine formamidase
MSVRRVLGLVAAVAVGLVVGRLGAQPTSGRGWQSGKGYGWVWGERDEVGALNALGPREVMRAVRTVRDGRVYDMGVTYDRTSSKWPGHSPGEIISFRTPEGVKRQGDSEFTKGPANALGTAWHSCALFISDNVGTQIDGLGHVTVGEQNTWYNGFQEAEWGGNWGIRKCGAETIPPIVTRGVLLDVAGHRKVDALPAHTRLGAKDLQAVMAAQQVEIEPGDAVFIRTGTLRYWGETGADQAKLAEHDSAGIDLEAAKWLVEQKGAILIGSDTSGLEVNPAPEGSRSFIPVHNYLLIEQGVHVGEYHNLEELARDRVYRFCYIVGVNKIKGAVAGFTLRPIALR